MTIGPDGPDPIFELPIVSPLPEVLNFLPSPLRMSAAGGRTVTSPPPGVGGPAGAGALR